MNEGRRGAILGVVFGLIYVLLCFIVRPAVFAQKAKKLSEKEFMEQTIIQQDDQLQKQKELIAVKQEQIVGIQRQYDALLLKCNRMKRNQDMAARLLLENLK